jgi:hypothetical protein
MRARGLPLAGAKGQGCAGTRLQRTLETLGTETTPNVITANPDHLETLGTETTPNVITTNPDHLETLGIEQPLRHVH